MGRALDVLVVDDVPFVRDAACRLLRLEGLTAEPAAGGREAVDAFRALGGSVGVVLLDVRMPPPDGPATLALLREIDPAVRCCFLTGGGHLPADRLLALGACRVYLKPVPCYAALARDLRAVIAVLPSPPPAR